VRLNTQAFRVQVQYDPGSAKTISAWASALDALLVANGSYFAPESEGRRETIGLLVSDGHRWGTPLDDYAGMLAVNGSGEVSVRWLRHRPYDPAEPLIEAMQSFPVLVKPGGVMGFPADADDGAPARRTVVARDEEGNILFILAVRGTLSLHELAVFLVESDLTIDVALNLDGGGSSGLWLTTADAPIQIDSYTPVPSVIAVERR
jgi:exopolysaccharide biosynthesis protein